MILMAIRESPPSLKKSSWAPICSIPISSCHIPAIARYVSMQFAGHAFPEGFPQLIHQRTEGHPLFVADLLRDLRRRQVIRQQDGRWIMTADLHSLERELPPSVRSLVQRKIEALDDEDRPGPLVSTSTTWRIGSSVSNASMPSCGSYPKGKRWTGR